MNNTVSDIGCPDQTFINLRKEPRFQAAGIADVKLVNPAAGLRLSAAIVDVSRSGLQIEVEEPLNSGSGVEIRLSESVVMGEVCNCRPHGEGRYRAGILTIRMVDSPLSLLHLPDVDHLPYVLNDALTEAQRHYYTRRLGLCP